MYLFCTFFSSVNQAQKTFERNDIAELKLLPCYFYFFYERCQCNLLMAVLPPDCPSITPPLSQICVERLWLDAGCLETGSAAPQQAAGNQTQAILNLPLG